MPPSQVPAHQSTRHQPGISLTAVHQGNEPIGGLLARLRLAQGLSQSQLAGRLCSTAGSPTVTRHEVHRWERGARIPGRFWLTWLAAVLEVPLQVLEQAVVRTRPPAKKARSRPATLWREPSDADLLATLEHGPIGGLAELARCWLSGATADGAAGRAGALSLPDGDGKDLIGALQARLRDLRRMDDVVGGRDLASVVDQHLRATVTAVGNLCDGRLRARALRTVAGYAQLTGWVHSDAGDDTAAQRAYRMALRAATGARDNQFGAYILGSLACHEAFVGRPRDALALAQTAVAGSGRKPALLRALLLHRVADAASRVNEQREAEQNLLAAQRAAEYVSAEDRPDWLYWLGQEELTTMAGRCLANLGRPLRALPILGRPRPGLDSRTAALDGIALARCLAEVGELEEACRVASNVLVRAIAIGSARVTTGLRHLHPVLLRHREHPAATEYGQRIAVADRQLP